MVSQKALDLIKKFEGCKLNAYLDLKKIPTIGFGSTLYNNGSKVKMGDTITQEQADDMLSFRCEQIERMILGFVKPQLNENQLSALISFVYNIGMNAFRFSTLLLEINKGNFDKAAAQFDKWIYVNKNKSEGLANRRAAEKSLFLSL